MTIQVVFGNRFYTGPGWGCPVLGHRRSALPEDSPSPPSLQGLRAWGWAGTVLSRTYADSPFSKLAVEGHLDFVLVPSPLIEGVTAVEGRAVQMQANGRLCVAYVLHTVQANGVYTSEGHERRGWVSGKT